MSSDSGQAFGARNQVGTEAVEAPETRFLFRSVYLGACAVTRHLTRALEGTGNLGNLVGGI